MANFSTKEQITAQNQVSAGQRDRLAGLLQFPRRVILLLLAFGLASALIGVLPGLLPQAAGLTPELQQRLEAELAGDAAQTEPFSLITQQPVAELLAQSLPNTLLLLGAAWLLALLLALPLIFGAVLAHKLEEGAGPMGSVLKWLGRLVIFGLAARPVFALGLFFLYIFAFQLGWLPPGGLAGPGGEGNLAGRLPHLILPTLTLALLPAMFTAQAVARQITLPGQSTGPRRWLGGLFQLMATLLGQVGGLLSASVLVENLFFWPGLGRLMITSAAQFDFPVLLGILGAYSGLILAGRLAAELFSWLNRLTQPADKLPVRSPTPPDSRWPGKAQTIWLVVAMALLIVPVLVVGAGLFENPDQALTMDISARLQGASAEHPWGTDAMGRDLQARVLRGGLVTVGTAVAAAAIVLLPGGLVGGLAGFLAARRRLWSESAADVLLIPADILLFIPAVPGGIVIGLMLNAPTWLAVSLMVALVLLPRAVRVYQTLWLAAPPERPRLRLGTAGLGALFLGTLFAAIGLVASLEFLGFAGPPPLPTLGSVLSDGTSQMAANPTSVQAAAIVLWACTFPCYTAADALVNFFYSKEALARLNE